MTLAFCQLCENAKKLGESHQVYEISRSTTNEQAQEIQSKLKGHIFSAHPEAIEGIDADEWTFFVDFSIADDSFDPELFWLGSLESN